MSAASRIVCLLVAWLGQLAAQEPVASDESVAEITPSQALIAGINSCNAGDLGEAERLLRACSAQAEASGDTVISGVARGFLGLIALRGGKAAEARPHLDAAWHELHGSSLEQRRALDRLGVDPLDLLALVAETRGAVLVALGELEEAQACLQDFVELARQQGHHDYEGQMGAQLAEVVARRGDVPGATKLMDEALSKAPESGAARALVRLRAGRFFSEHGDRARANQLFAEAAQAVPAADIDLQIAIGGERAYLAVAGDDYARAREFAVAALELARRTNGNPALQVDALTMSATVAFHSGDPWHAQALLEEAAVLLEGMTDVSRRMMVLGNLAVVLRDLGDLLSARERYEEALALSAEPADSDGLALARFSTLHGLARLLDDTGDLEQARPLAGEALALAERLEDPDAIAQARMLTSWLDLRAGDVDAARPVADMALAHVRASGATELELHVLHTLARLDVLAGDTAAARERLAGARALLEREDMARLQSIEASSIRSRLAAWSEVTQDLALIEGARSPEAVEEGWRGAGHWKARTLLEGLTRQRPIDASATSADVLEALGSDVVVIDYAEATDRLAAYVLHRGGLELIDLGERRALEDEVARFVEGIAVPPLDAAATVASRGRDLYERLVAPCLAVAATRDLIIVPSPGLCRLPFEALVTATTGEAGRAPRGFDELRFLDEDVAITYAPSSPVLHALASRGARAEPGRVLLVGDPIYPGEVQPGLALADARSSTLERYGRLEQSREEIFELGQMLLVARRTEADFPDRIAELALAKLQRSGSVKTSAFDLLVGAASCRSGLLGDLSGYGVLHFAAHGLVDVRDPRRSALLLSWDESSQGLLSLVDVLDLELDADLVVASACDMARGRVLKGEGVQSMAQAFLQAGSRAVAASLWAVDDRDADAVMQRFYRGFVLEGRARSGALQEAKRDLRRAVLERGSSLLAAGRPPAADPGHPHVWAPFIWIGAR